MSFVKAPKFWFQKKMHVYAWLLYPFSCIVSFVASLRQKTGRYTRASFPVISIGGITVGGSGKTSVTLACAQFFKEMGMHPVIFSGGYGGRVSKKAIFVDIQCHTARDVGDEALIFAKFFPTYVASQRDEALDLLAQNSRTIILLDDAHQHRSLHKDFSLLVIDGQQKLGNGCVIPAGPLRENIRKALKRTDVCLHVNCVHPLDIEHSNVKCLHIQSHVPSSLKDNNVLAFAGLGYPAKFAHALVELGLDVKIFIPFPDHYLYQAKDEQRLQCLARHNNLSLVCTEKDAVKLSPHFRRQVHVITQSVPNLVEFFHPIFKQFVSDTSL